MSGLKLEAEQLPDGWLRIELSDWTVAAVQEFSRVTGHRPVMRGTHPSPRKGFWLIDVSPDVAAAIAKIAEDPDAALRIVLSGQMGRA